MGLTHHLPNALSLLRILLTPLIIMGIHYGQLPRALVLAVVAGLTDALDGWAARYFGSESKLGQVLDPLADKVLQVGVFVALGLAGLVPAWIVTLVFGRDLLILAFAGVFLLSGKRTEFEPSLWGKVSTILQVAAVVFVLAEAGEPLVPLSLALVAVGTAWSGLHYWWRAMQWVRPGIPKKP